MHIFEVAAKIGRSGEYILGSRDTGSHACYLIYGVLKPGEGGREFRPGAGHEELIFAVTGDLVLRGAWNGTLTQGQALHLRGEESCVAENTAQEEVRYVIAGGHAEGGHGH